MIYITQATRDGLERCIQSLGEVLFLGKETRVKHSAIYPKHNRYFTNGDKPWVILVNHKNSIKLLYDETEYIIHENELVCFDDNILHAWEMQDNNLTIYYYRAKANNAPIIQGTYCIDGLHFDSLS